MSKGGIIFLVLLNLSLALSSVIEISLPDSKSTGPSGITCAESGVCAGKPDGTLFADPNGNGYIVCQCECGIERPCPEGTKFNEQLLVCDHIPATPSPATPSPATPSPATPKPPTPSPATPSPATPSPATPSPATPSPATPSPATPSPATPKPPTSGSTGTPSSTGPSGITCAESGVCAGKPDGTLFADPNSNGYIVCQCECAIERPCPEGTKFDAQLLTCDHIPATPSPATPSPATPKPPTPSPATPSPATPSPATTSPATPSPATPKPPTSGSTGTPSSTGPSGITCAESGVCAGKPDGTLFADPKSNGYIVCQCECAIERPCPEGTKFDAQLLTCDHIAGTPVIPSTPSPVTPSPVTPSPVTPSPVTPSPVTPSPVTPSPVTPSPVTPSPVTPSPVTPSPVTPSPVTPSPATPSPATPAPGPSGNETIITCPNNVQLCKDQEEGTLFPVDGVCNKFYKCNYGCAIEIPCPYNLVYNPTQEYCDYPQNYKCPWPYTPPSGPSAGPSGIACPSGGRCVGQEEGTLFPSLTSCSKYVICQCECEVELNCSQGLVWDQKLLTCNYPEYVQCKI